VVLAVGCNRPTSGRIAHVEHEGYPDDDSRLRSPFVGRGLPATVATSRRTAGSTATATVLSGFSLVVKVPFVWLEGACRDVANRRVVK
jgi:hypothetical protein